MTIAALMLLLSVTPASSPATQDRPAAAASGPMLLDFHADWCGPCRQMRPAVAKLIQTGYPVKSIDIDRSPALAERYHVKAVPCFIVVDETGRELDRAEGAQPASQLATLFNRSTRDMEAKAQVADRAAPRQTLEVSNEKDGETTLAPAQKAKNPKPWQTVVRIKVHDAGQVGFGSGTIIYSTSEEAIILSCAHIFKIRTPVSSPKHFNRPVSVDLFDGKVSQTQPPQVHYANESYKAEVIDYDFGKDVSLIRIRPGRKLLASPVVPADWVAQTNLEMIAVGCPEGQDATAWSTKILTTKLTLDNNTGYEGMGCKTAPKQGRSGGGLYTMEGFVAGVCDFAEPKGNVGLYASPRSIHRLLDRNQMMAMYERPQDPDRRTLLANNRPKPARTDQGKAPMIARGQSPDTEDSADVTIPSPELLGIGSPGSERVAGGGSSRLTNPRRKPVAPSEDDRAWTTELRRSRLDIDDEVALQDDEDLPAPKPTTPVRTKSKWQRDASDF